MSIQAMPLHPTAGPQAGPQPADKRVQEAREVQEAFRSFVGQTFFGQLLKSMRSTQGKPAYFHGGRAEEIFRGQLDQTLADKMTESSADRIADPMFRQQFPEQARILNEAQKQNDQPLTLDDLATLR